MLRIPDQHAAQFSRLPRLVKAEVQRMADRHIGIDLAVTAVVKDSLSHTSNRAVDLALFLSDGTPHPMERGVSQRLTDKKLLHAELIRLRPRVAWVVENDHYHVTDLLPPGVYLYDNPRDAYAGERLLTAGPDPAYPGVLRRVEQLWPVRRVWSPDEVVATVTTNDNHVTTR